MMTGPGRPLLRWLLGALLAIHALARPGLAQQAAPGMIEGRVADAQGGPVGGALVELSRSGVLIQRREADAAGGFRFGPLPPDRYQVRAQHIGYRGAAAETVIVTSGERAQVRLTLELAPVELERVEVVVPPVRIDRENTDFGTELTSSQIQLLPTPKSASELVAYTAGSRPGQVWGGATAQANNYKIDGLFANHPGVGGELVEPSIRWIERVEVIGLGAGADQGDFQGGIVSVTTKSGTNRTTGALYTDVESAALNASNLGPGEIGSEVESRYEVEGEVSGPIVRDRLFYFAAGSFIDGQRRYLNHLQTVEDYFAPPREERVETKLFGKLSWAPGPRDRIDATYGRVDTEIDHFGTIGYEAADASLRMTAPTTFSSLAWQHSWDWGVLDLRGASFTRDERRQPYNGPDHPGLWTWGTVPPYTAYANAPIRYRQFAESRTGAASLTLELPTGPLRHRIEIGGEYTDGAWLNERKRNGGMTFRPVMGPRFDPRDPSTWTFRAGGRPFLPTVFGGEVHLDADVENSALYVQDQIDFGARVTLTPGLRYGRWRGWLRPRDGGARFLAAQDEALDPRIGLSVDVTGENDFVLKAHWGRYHQSMFAQFFDRAEGGDVYTDQATYYWWHPDVPDPTRPPITEEEIPSLVESGDLKLIERVRLNQSGPVEDYNQPYIDQWLVGIEKMLTPNWKAEAVYVNRRNRDMVGLVDRNIESNYTAFNGVRVFQSGAPLDYRGLPLRLDRVYVDHETLYRYLQVAWLNDYPIPEGFVTADTVWLKHAWNPDYVLTTIPQATRKFDQYQFTIEGSFARWGASASVVFTDLRGNFDTVTGYEQKTAYDEPFLYSAGPYVNPNESVNYQGRMSEYSDRELKLAVFGEIGWQIHGGAYWNWATGDWYSPYFVLSTLNWSYDKVPVGLFENIAGQRVFVEERGARQVERRATLDLRAERRFELPNGMDWVLTLDMLNFLNFNTITDVNPMVNYGKRYNPKLRPKNEDPQQFYDAVRERLRPRTLRLGTSVRF